LGTKRTDLRDDPPAENRPFDCPPNSLHDPPKQSVEKLEYIDTTCMNLGNRTDILSQESKAKRFRTTESTRETSSGFAVFALTVSRCVLASAFYETNGPDCSRSLL
jgi:hypothetical protein